MTFTKTATATLIAAAFPAIFGSAAWAQSNGSADMYQRNEIGRASCRERV